MMRALMLTTVLWAGAISACGDATPPPPPPRGTTARADQAVTAAQDPQTAPGGAGANGDGGANNAGGRAPPLPIVDTDLAESDRTRDPFRSFAQEFVPIGPAVPLDEHAIKLRDVGLDQLQLVAVILGTGNPYAMVVDTSGTGTIIRRGEYVGRPEMVAGGEGQLAHQLPWRVARITGSRVSRDRDNNLTEVPGEVVFEREDRLNPTAARAEHVITLAPGSQATRPADAPTTTGPPIPTIPGFGPGASPFLPTGPAAVNRANGSTTVVQSYTSVTPAQPPQQAPPTTVVIQTGPHGETTVNGTPSGGSPNGGGVSPPTTTTSSPYGAPPPGGNANPPPVQINSGPAPQPLPLHGLP